MARTCKQGSFTKRSYYLALVIATAFSGASTMRGAVGDLYEADFGSGNVYRYTPAGAKSIFASGLGNPAGVTFDAKGNLFVSDSLHGIISKISPAGAKSTFASGLNKPWGLGFDSNGNLFEGDNGSGVISKFTPTGGKTVFATGLNGPAGLAIDAANNVYEADFNSGTIFKFTPAGARTTLAAGLGNPDAIESNRVGNLLEAGGASGGNVFSIAPNGAKTVFAGGFSQPTGVAVDGAGDVFVSDNATGTITKIAPGGARTTFATGLFNPQNLVFEPPTAQLNNISTRVLVGTGNNVSIAGFIIHGTQPKLVLIRGLGPTLGHFGITNPLQDPTLELHAGTRLIASNNDWQSAPNAGQIPVNLRPPDSRESAILITLAPGSYTATEAGRNSTTGVGLVEVYDLNTLVFSELTNISTRGFVETGQNVMIGGFINSGGNGNTQVLVRALGPSLRPFGITNPLPNPTLKIANANGQIVASNDDWKTTQQSAIQGTGLAPMNDLESAILISLPNAAHTAIVADENGASGVALVEVYKIR
jgi:hypothetical protein